MRFILYMVFGGLLFSCGGSDQGPVNKIPVAPSSVFMEAEYHFCGEKDPDRFLVGYHGEQATDNEIHFLIICNSGDTLYQTTWEANSLLADSLREAVDAPTREALIQKNIKSIVLNNPPKIAQDTIPGYGPVSPETIELLAESQAPRVFVYRLGDGAPRMIAWSEGEKAVIEITQRPNS